MAGTATVDRATATNASSVQPGRAAAAVDVGVDTVSTRSVKVDSAVSMSLSPWPVTVITTVLPARSAPAACSSSSAGDAGRRGRLDEDAVAGGELALGGQDLLVGDLRNMPPDSSAAATARSQEAGLPIRIAVATVSGSGTGAPITIGAAPAAWKPRITGVLVASPEAGVLR